MPETSVGSNLVELTPELFGHELRGEPVHEPLLKKKKMFVGLQLWRLADLREAVLISLRSLMASHQTQYLQ